MNTIARAEEDLEVEPGKRVMRIMDPKEGDMKLVWDPDNEVEVAHARETFDKMRKKGLAAFRVDKKGDKAKTLTEFDPDAAAMILAPALAGG